MDACDNTGLSAVSWFDGVVEQVGSHLSITQRSETLTWLKISIFYIDWTNALREKRLNHTSGGFDSPSGLPGKWLSSLYIKPGTDDRSSCGNGSSYNWDTLRIAAVHFPTSDTGPGTRLFFHQSTWIQELLWTQSTNTWTFGSTFSGSTACSRLTVTLENSMLRFFYLSDDLVLQEVLLNVTQPGATWKAGKWPTATSK